MGRPDDFLAAHQSGGTWPQFTYSSSPSRRTRAKIRVAYFSPICLWVKNWLIAGHDFGQRHAGGKLRVHHPLQSGGQQRRRNSLAAHICQHHRQSLFGVHRIKEIAADFLAGKIPSPQLRKGDFRNRHRHQPLLDGRGDCQLLLIPAGGFFGLHQAGVFHQRRRFGGDHPQNIVAHPRHIVRSEARVHVQRAHGLAGTREWPPPAAD